MSNYKDKYNEIKIPEELDFVIKKSIKRGKREMVRKKRKSFMGSIAIAASFLLLFVFGLNTSPSFAEAVSKLPGGETMVRVLTFNQQGEIDGGELGDGQDIKDFDTEKEDGWERFTIKLDGGIDGVASNFKIIPMSYPHGLLIELSGTRSFTGIDRMPDFSEYELFGSFYRLITLDDQLVRFAMTFNKAVEYEIVEKQNPARIIISVKEDAEAKNEGVVYSLRTNSYQFGEEIGHIESILKYELESTNARMIEDAKGYLLVEEGLYQTEAEAVAKMEQLQQLGIDFNLYIEQRNPFDIPRKIVQ